MARGGGAWCSLKWRVCMQTMQSPSVQLRIQDFDGQETGANRSRPSISHPSLPREIPPINLSFEIDSTGNYNGNLSYNGDFQISLESE